MSKIRKALESMNHDEIGIDDLAQLFEEWDIPPDERITRVEAKVWLLAQLLDTYATVGTCTEEGMDTDEWETAIEFVWRCLRHGVVPHEYIHLLIERQQTFDDSFGDEPRTDW